MGGKSDKINPLVAPFRGRALDARYLAFFDCFNRRLYFEAHEVLEDLWLEDRQGPDGDFYKGLIQLAGAFVHVQKERFQPAASLLKLAQANLCRYPETHHQLPRREVESLIQSWLLCLPAHPAAPDEWPKLRLISS